MATEADIVKLVAFRLGNVRGLDAMIQAELANTITRLEANDFLPWFLLSENNTYITKKGENRVPVPDGFLKEYDNGALYWLNEHTNVWIPIKKRSQQTNRLHHQINDPTIDIHDNHVMGEDLLEGSPESYSLTNTYFRMFPRPDRAYTLELLFYRKSSTLPQGVQVWYDNAQELLVAETAAMMMLARQDKRYMEYKGLADLEMRKLKGRHEERDISNQDLSMGGDY